MNLLLTRVLALIVLLTEILGVLCQFIQTTDPTPPLTYFTVNSAILAAIAAVATLAWPHRAITAQIRGIAATGVIVSGLAYALVIAPTTPTGSWIQPWDDIPVRISTIVLHGVAPPLLLLFYLAAPVEPVSRTLPEALRWLGWPAVYLAALSLGATVGAWAIPYPFLRPSVSGWGPVFGAAAGLTALLLGVSLVLLVLGRRLTHLARQRHAPSV